MFPKKIKYLEINEKWTSNQTEEEIDTANKFLTSFVSASCIIRTNKLIERLI
jgi:hypothetical protein